MGRTGQINEGSGIRVPIRRRTRLRARSKTPATHRHILPRKEYAALVAWIRVRENGRCWSCHDPGDRPVDVHYVVKRSAGGEDSASNCLLLGRTCQDRTDAALAHGRLVIEALGGQRFSKLFQWPTVWLLGERWPGTQGRGTKFGHRPCFPVLV